MLGALHKLGHHVTRFFGDTDLGLVGTSKRDTEERHSLFSGTSFATLLPYEAFDEESGLFIGPNSVGFALEAIPLVGADPAIEKVLSSFFQELLDEGASLQVLLLADHRTDRFLNAWESARQEATQTLREIAQRRRHHFSSSPAISPRLFRCVLSYSLSINTRRDHNILDNIRQKREKFLETLKHITFARSWRPEDLLEFVGGLVNFSLDTQVKTRQWNPLQSLASQLTTGGKIRIEEEALTWTTDTEIQFKSFRAIDVPSYWSLQGMQSLIGDILRDPFRIHTPFFLHYGVHCPKQSTAEASFWRNAYLVENQGKSATLLRWIPELEKELKENDQVRRSLSQGSRFVWTQLSAGIFSPKEKIHQAQQSLTHLFRINQFLLAENRCMHLPQFIASLPMTWADYVQDLKNLNLLRTTLSTECVNFVPIQGEWMGTPTPHMLLIGRRGQLLNWNPFDNKLGNYNIAVVGRSGSGKSVFMQDLLLSGLSTGASVFILDVGRSFEKMCTLLEGQHIEFSKESQICLNPFTHISLQDSDERDTSFSFLKSIISCMAAPTEGTSDYENALIEKAIRSAWESQNQKATITNVAAWLQAHDDPRAKTLGVMLTPYTREGIYAKHFEGRNNVNFNNGMVLIELEELKEKKDLQTVVLQLFIMAITHKALLGERKTPFFICLDEGWDLLRGKQSGPFIETLARRLRKYYGSLVVGTQSIDDFFATPGAKAAFDNSDWLCLLSQKGGSITALAESKKIEFSEAKRQALESISTRQGSYSEVMICDAEGNYAIGRLSLDPFSELLYTTKAQEFSKIKELQRQGLSITQAIEELLKNRRTHG